MWQRFQYDEAGRLATIRDDTGNQIDIVNNGFLDDFRRAYSNRLLTGNPACTAAQNPNCQPLTVFPKLGSGGLLNNATILGLIDSGTPGQLAVTYLSNRLEGSVAFRKTPNLGAALLLSNSADTITTVCRWNCAGYFRKASHSKQITHSRRPSPMLPGPIRTVPIEHHRRPFTHCSQNSVGIRWRFIIFDFLTQPSPRLHDSPVSGRSIANVLPISTSRYPPGGGMNFRGDKVRTVGV